MLRTLLGTEWAVLDRGGLGTALTEAADWRRDGDAIPVARSSKSDRRPLRDEVKEVLDETELGRFCDFSEGGGE
jgi:hypothetical protein